MRALVLINPGARQGTAYANTAVQQLRDLGVEATQVQADKVTDWPALIGDYADRIECVVIGGGDGSLNLAAGPIMRHGLTLGVLPLGTANDFARTLGYPNDLLEACRVVAEGVDHRVDLGRVNDVYFLNVASIGLAVRARRYRSGQAKRWFGAMGYAGNVYAAFRDTHAFRVSVTCDGVHRELHSIQIAVGNGRYFGGGLAVSEDAAIDDGKLDLFSLEPQSVGAALRLVPALLRGPAPSTERGELIQGEHIRVVTSRPRSINTDGEVLTRTPAEFRVLPQALTVRVPAAYRDEFLERDAASRAAD